MEALRTQKDAKIRQMDRDKEDQRHQYEVKLNDLDSKIKSKIFPFINPCLLNRTGTKDTRPELDHPSLE